MQAEMHALRIAAFDETSECFATRPAFRCLTTELVHLLHGDVINGKGDDEVLIVVAGVQPAQVVGV